MSLSGVVPPGASAHRKDGHVVQHRFVARSHNAALFVVSAIAGCSPAPAKPAAPCVSVMPVTAAPASDIVHMANSGSLHVWALAAQGPPMHRHVTALPADFVLADDSSAPTRLTVLEPLRFDAMTMFPAYSLQKQAEQASPRVLIARGGALHRVQRVRIPNYSRDTQGHRTCLEDAEVRAEDVKLSCPAPKVRWLSEGSRLQREAIEPAVTATRADGDCVLHRAALLDQVCACFAARLGERAHPIVHIARARWTTHAAAASAARP